tara:strand:- start:492 stop:1631 length:1140 start_codon:yes stop_codon:yes gene_type:complete
MGTKSNTKISRILFFVALCIVSVTLWYTNSLANKLKVEEQKKVALWAKATKELSEISSSNYNIGFVFEVVNNNTTVPVIQVNEDGEIIAHRNIKGPHTDIELQKQVKLMKKKYPPIEVELINGSKEYIFYKDSRLLQNLKNFPFFILTIIGAFIFVAYIAFSNARIAEQNKVWTGMAKETAHQIGTPLSSLMGWVEILKSKKNDKQTVSEIENDLERLSVIASRFSKIGSLPKLKKVNLVSLITNSVAYMQKRASSKVVIDFRPSNQYINILINEDLFDWVIENMIKNSFDAISQKGIIKIRIDSNRYHTYIDIIDNGVGIKKSQFKEIFEPGFTSKKRGWGLGLSLAKRIIHDYHKGQIKLLHSKPNLETKFRITLKN